MNKYHVTWSVRTNYNKYGKVEMVHAPTQEKAAEIVQTGIWQIQFPELSLNEIEIVEVTKIKSFY